MKPTLDFWQQPEFSIFSALGRMTTSVEDLEDIFKQRYPNSFPVVFPSARTGILCILEHFGANRPKLVYVPAFSSMCVFSTIAKIATPTINYNDPYEIALVYHNFGYTHKFPKKCKIIEDSVDSLLKDESDLFPNDGPFEVFSLPKLLGTTLGGLVLCQNSSDAESLKKLREAKFKLGWLQFILRTYFTHDPLGVSYWHRGELFSGNICSLGLGHIASRLGKFDSLVSERESKLDLLSTSGKNLLELKRERLACMGLIPFSEENKKVILEQELYIGDRHFKLDLDYGSGTPFEKILPLPIHCQVNSEKLQKTLDQIQTK